MFWSELLCAKMVNVFPDAVLNDALLTRGLHENAAKALLFGAAAFILCFALLSLLMAYVKKRQKQQSDELDDE